MGGQGRSLTPVVPSPVQAENIFKCEEIACLFWAQVVSWQMVAPDLESGGGEPGGHGSSKREQVCQRKHPGLELDLRPPPRANPLAPIDLPAPADRWPKQKQSHPGPTCSRV